MLTQQTRQSVRSCQVPGRQRSVPCCARAASLAAPTSAPQHVIDWAIVKVGHTTQMVEVGSAVALRACKEATLGKLVQFREVVAFKTGSSRGQLTRSKDGAYLTDVLVEGVVSDQWVGPALCTQPLAAPLAGSTDASSTGSSCGSSSVTATVPLSGEPVPLQKVIITRITQAGPAALHDSN